MNAIMSASTQFEFCAVSELALSPETVSSPLLQHLHPSVELCCRARGMSRAGVSTGVVVENWPEFWASSLCFFHLVLSVSKHVHALHEERLGPAVSPHGFQTS